MKKYIIPTIDVTALSLADVLTLSGESNHLRSIQGNAEVGGSSSIGTDFWS